MHKSYVLHGTLPEIIMVDRGNHLFGLRKHGRPSTLARNHWIPGTLPRCSRGEALRDLGRSGDQLTIWLSLRLKDMMG